MTTSNAAAAFAAGSAGTPPAGTPPAGATGAAPTSQGAGTPPAGTPPAGGSAPAANEGNWFDGFANADVKTWTAAKGFKDASAVAESAYNLEKLIGFEKAGRTIVVPKDDASPEEMAAFNAKLGVPASPTDYKLPLPEGSDPKLAETIQGWMHRAGATPKVADSLTKEFIAYSQQVEGERIEKLIATSDKAFTEVTGRWGKDADANIELGKRFTSQLLPAEVALDDGTKVSRQEFLERIFNTTGATAAMLELFANAGKGLGEHRMRSDGSSAMGDTPATAQQKIAALKADSVWVKAYLGGDKTKAAEMERLTKIAFPAGQ